MGEMGLGKDIYRALEDIVGPENISEDICIIDSYCRSWGEEVMLGPGFKWMPRFSAIVLPGNTKEVQALVKVCNRWNVRFKAHSTGYGPMMCSLKEGCLCLDMRRMNRILEINEKGMYAVVEPAVIGAQLQAELMKRGFITGMIDPGAGTSAVPIVPTAGEGLAENTYANTHRNQLALEWVLPTGEILRTGSLGSGAGWFSSEGPGPSLRGIACGEKTTYGGVGVFTKAAVKLYHWQGPPAFPIKGVSPNYRFEGDEMNFGFWFITVPSYEKAAEAGYKIGQAEIAIVLHKGTAWRIASDSAGSMEEAWERFKKIHAQIDGRGRISSWIVIIGADTEKEFQYKEKVLRQIVKDVDGELLPFLEDAPDIKLGFISRWIRGSSCDRETRRAGGARLSGFITLDSIDHQMKIASLSADLKREYIKAGRMVDDGGDHGISMFGEQGRVGHLEQMAMTHNNNEGNATIREFVSKSVEMMLDSRYKIIGNVPSFMMRRPPSKEEWGKMQEEEYARMARLYPHNENTWLERINRAFDPNNVSDSSFYSP